MNLVNFKYVFEFLDKSSADGPTEITNALTAGAQTLDNNFILIFLISFLLLMLGIVLRKLALTNHNCSIKKSDTLIGVKPKISVFCIVISLILLLSAIVFYANNAFATANNEPDTQNVKAYVDKNTGEISIDSAYINNDDMQAFCHLKNGTASIYDADMHFLNDTSFFVNSPELGDQVFVSKIDNKLLLCYN